MGVIKVILITIEVITSCLLIGVILLQKSKDEGLGLAFGAGVGETLFGSRAGNVLTKITIGLAVVFLVNTLLIGLVVRGGGGAGRSVTDSLPREAAAPAQSAAPEQAGIPDAAPAAVPETAPAAPAATPETPAPAAKPAAP